MRHLEVYQFSDMINVLIRHNMVFGLFSEDEEDPDVDIYTIQVGSISPTQLRLVIKTVLQVMDQWGVRGYDSFLLRRVMDLVLDLRLGFVQGYFSQWIQSP